MKFTVFLCTLLLMIACQKSPQASSPEQSITHKEDPIVSHATVEESPAIVTKINDDEARKLDVSTDTIAKKIRLLLFNSDHEMTIEELLDQQITLSNNKGKLLNLPLKSVMDTVYYQ